MDSTNPDIPHREEHHSGDVPALYFTGRTFAGGMMARVSALVERRAATGFSETFRNLVGEKNRASVARLTEMLSREGPCAEMISAREMHIRTAKTREILKANEAADESLNEKPERLYAYVLLDKIDGTVAKFDPDYSEPETPANFMGYAFIHSLILERQLIDGLDDSEDPLRRHEIQENIRLASELITETFDDATWALQRENG